jgi:uncharacterized protein
MNHFLRIFVMLLSITLAATSLNATPTQAPIKVLIVDGFSNHDWKATTQEIQKLLKNDPNLISEVSTVPTQETEDWANWLPNFSDYDVIIQNTTDINVGGSWPRPAQIALESYMANGGGLYIFHSANNAFPEWEAYNRMIGLGWRKKDFGPAIQIIDDQTVLIPAGEGGNTGHGKRFDALITRINDHPIHQDLPKQWLAADLEVYRYARGPAENLTVISYAMDPSTEINFPIEWVIQYGKGRAYNSTFGHHWHDVKETPNAFRCVAFQTIFNRAIYWLADREINPAVPANFPTSEHISITP